MEIARLLIRNAFIVAPSTGVWCFGSPTTARIFSGGCPG